MDLATFCGVGFLDRPFVCLWDFWSFTSIGNACKPSKAPYLTAIGLFGESKGAGLLIA